MYSPPASGAHALAATGAIGIANGVLAASVLIALGVALFGLAYWRRGEWK